jgi:hypothetical protein
MLDAVTRALERDQKRQWGRSVFLIWLRSPGRTFSTRPSIYLNAKREQLESAPLRDAPKSEGNTSPPQINLFKI